MKSLSCKFNALRTLNSLYETLRTFVRSDPGMENLAIRTALGAHGGRQDDPSICLFRNDLDRHGNAEVIAGFQGQRVGLRWASSPGRVPVACG